MKLRAIFAKSTTDTKPSFSLRSLEDMTAEAFSHHCPDHGYGHSQGACPGLQVPEAVLALDPLKREVQIELEVGAEMLDRIDPDAQWALVDSHVVRGKTKKAVDDAASRLDQAVRDSVHLGDKCEGERYAAEAAIDAERKSMGLPLIARQPRFRRSIR